MEEPQTGQTSAHEGIEAMAFQVLLQKVSGLERAMQSIPPLLTKIIAHLEAQTQHPEVPVATYAQLYPELGDEAPEEAVTPERVPLAPVRPRRVWHWFTREV
jgi:hypothetical protein